MKTHWGPGKPFEVMSVLKSSTAAPRVLPRTIALPSPKLRVLPFALACDEEPCVWKLAAKPPQVWVELLVEWNARPGPVQVTFTVIGSARPPPGGGPPLPPDGAAWRAPN